MKDHPSNRTGTHSCEETSIVQMLSLAPREVDSGEAVHTVERVRTGVRPYGFHSCNSDHSGGRSEF